MKLSILVPSVAERRNTFLPKALNMLYGQLEKLPETVQSQVEILFLIDNKTIMLGDKRNLLVGMAKGEYISFVDCDDRVSDDYISSLLEGIKSGADCVTFLAEVSINGQKPKICRYSIDYEKDENLENEYLRLPNHIPCIKRSVSKMVSFPSLKRAEDFGYAVLLKPHLKSEIKIDKVLYYYDYNEDTTVAQDDIPHIRAKRLVSSPAICDVIFVSNGEKITIRQMTQTAIDTAISGANGLRINCIVMESQQGVRYQNAVTLYPAKEFNYNAYLNYGAMFGKAERILFCNNDLVFRNGWLHALISADYPVTSPICGFDKRQFGVNENERGWTCGRNLAGWCFMLTRELWKKIGGLDEEFDFWFADNSLIGQLKKIGVEPMAVPLARVDHLGSQTLNRLSNEERQKKMWSKLDRFNEKYGEKLFIDHPNYLEWKKSQSQ